LVDNSPFFFLSHLFSLFKTKTLNAQNYFHFYVISKHFFKQKNEMHLLKSIGVIHFVQGNLFSPFCFVSPLKIVLGGRGEVGRILGASDDCLGFVQVCDPLIPQILFELILTPHVMPRSNFEDVTHLKI
jgi:hypothetical protein